MSLLIKSFLLGWFIEPPLRPWLATFHENDFLWFPFIWTWFLCLVPVSWLRFAKSNSEKHYAEGMFDLQFHLDNVIYIETAFMIPSNFSFSPFCQVLLNQIVLGPCVIAVVFAWNNLWQKKLSELPGKYRRDALPTLLYGITLPSGQLSLFGSAHSHLLISLDLICLCRI